MGYIRVGVGGQFENGKDTVADMLADEIAVRTGGRRPGRYAFAAAVKKVVCDTFDVTLEFVEHWKRRTHDIPPGFDMPMRDILIKVGDGFRAFRPTLWIDKVFGATDGFGGAAWAAGVGDAVVSDVRYFNEMKAVSARQGVNVLVWRPGYENDNPNPSEQELAALIRRYASAGIDGETGDAPCDWFVRNDGTEDDLRRHVRERLVPFVVCRAQQAG